MSSPPIFDLTAIERMRRFGNETLVRRMLDLFFESTPERYQAIIAALQSGDAETVRITAHSLKSSAGNLGARRLQALSQELEVAATSREVDRCAEITERIQQSLAPTFDALRNLPEFSRR